MTDVTDRDLTGQLIDSVIGVRFADLPLETVVVARQCILDWLGCALAGRDEPLTRILRDTVVGPASTGGPCSLVGSGRMTDPLGAALVNGAASHALDYDDTHMAMNGHPSAPVLPAVIALAEQTGASGAATLAAFVAGVELECRLGVLLGMSHYDIGFHATGTLGAFGAAAACAHLLGLSHDQWRSALGTAGTQAAGLKELFGTMGKPFHAGKAAQNGLLAAMLAQRGFTSTTDVVGGAQGFGRTHSQSMGHDVVPAGRWFIRETLFKYHAACYLTHAAITAADEIRRSGVRASDIEAIDLSVHRSLFNVCNIAEPATGLEGKFSLRATTALALLGADTSDPLTFSDATVLAPEVVSLRDRVHVRADRMASTASHVRATLAGGKVVERTFDSGIPAADLEAQGMRLEAKFRAVAGPVVGAERADLLIGLVRGFAEAPSVRSILA